MMMKRSIALLSGCLMLLLTACGASTPIPSGAEPAPLSPSPKDQGVRYQAELEEVSGESREGDILLLSYRYEVPVLRAYGEDGAEIPEEPGADGVQGAALRGEDHAAVPELPHAEGAEAVGVPDGDEL